MSEPTVTPDERATLEAMRDDTERKFAEARRLQAEGLPFTQAFVIASDRISAEQWVKDVDDGKIEVERAVWLLGSYARFDQAIRWVKAGRLSDAWLMTHLAELWRGSDPNDTDPDYVALWRRAWLANRRHPITDGRRLPAGNPLRIYRGQQALNEPLGCAWTLNPKIAAKFAIGIRVGTLKGEVLHGEIDRRRVFGYLSGRNESEVVVDPREVRIVARRPVEG